MAPLFAGLRGLPAVTVGFFVAHLASTTQASTTSSTPALRFNRDIRPILSENCFQCHGPDKNHRKGDLRLDVREEALEALAWVPGDAARSDAVKRIFSDDPDEQMPPKDSHRTLSTRQKETLRRWVAEGAAYEPHWAYSAPVRPETPAAASPTASAHPIDRFVDATLARERLTAAPAADRRTLLRRLSLDLTGLPPKPEDVEAFVASRDPQAYERWVDAYLASPHYGERMAIPWLDLVRFADTVGFHNDVPIRVWPYRDYVINAFNRNLPFDQFTREQLAGDLLPGSTPEQRVGSGYNRIHRMSVEGGIQDKEYFAKYAADRVRTTATVWMGSTLACAECHDHKFDPFTLKDFYRFSALFSDLKERGAYNLTGGFTRENLTEETLFETPAQKQRVEALTAEINRLVQKIDAVTDDTLAADRLAWEGRTLAQHRAGTLAWTVQRPLTAVSPLGTPLAIEAEDMSVIPGGINPVQDTYVVTVSAPLERITAVRIEVLQDARFPGDEVARAGSGFFISEIEVSGVAHETARPVRLNLASSQASSSTEPGHPARAAIDRDPDTSVSFTRKRGGGIALTLATPFAGGPDARLIVRIRHSESKPYQNLGRFRVALHTLPDPDPNPDGVPAPVLAALQVAAAARTPAQTKELVTYYRTLAPALAADRAQLLAARNDRDRLIESLPSMPVSKSVEPRLTRVLPRGNWMDDSGESVEPGVPSFLRQITPADGKRVSRLDFAEWLVAPDNPLTARTFVNRLWRLYFGEGLSRTLEDLGSQGEWPTHPELLDWLAVEFRESGWNVKHLVKLIVTSDAYRRSSRGTPELEERDPQNRFLARQNRFRLEAELVRDNALAVSGLLSPRIGGPSARPYQPAGYYAPLNFPRREYTPEVGEGLYRRGVYTHWQRTLLHPSLMAFDAPSRDECTVNRSTSNTPLQALVLLNDPTYVEAARTLAERILRGGGWSFPSRVTWAFQRAVARPPAPEEVRLLRRLFDQQRARYQADPDSARALLSTGARPVPVDLAPAELAAWTAVARALLNLHETVTRS
jgi:mono/diheme cytochrome c family protein